MSDRDSSPRMPARGAVHAPFFAHTILSGLPEQYSLHLLARAKTTLLKTGQILFETGDAGNGCYWLEEGALKVTIASPRGDERILAVLGPGSIVGELAMMDGLPRSATVEAIKDSKLGFLSRTAFLESVREHPVINSYLVSTLVARLRQADEEAAAASFLSVRARVARALLQLSQHLGEAAPTKGQVIIRHNLRQTDLAALAGVARESVSRTLSEWRKRNIIGHSSRSTYIIDRAKLEREAMRTG